MKLTLKKSKKTKKGFVGSFEASETGDGDVSKLISKAKELVESTRVSSSLLDGINQELDSAEPSEYHEILHREFKKIFRRFEESADEVVKMEPYAFQEVVSSHFADEAYKKLFELEINLDSCKSSSQGSMMMEECAESIEAYILRTISKYEELEESMFPIQEGSEVIAQFKVGNGYGYEYEVVSVDEKDSARLSGESKKEANEAVVAWLTDLRDRSMEKQRDFMTLVKEELKDPSLYGDILTMGKFGVALRAVKFAHKALSEDDSPEAISVKSQQVIKDFSDSSIPEMKQIWEASKKKINDELNIDLDNEEEYKKLDSAKLSEIEAADGGRLRDLFISKEARL